MQLASWMLWRPASAESSEFSLLHWLAAVGIVAASKLVHSGLPVAPQRMLSLRRTFREVD
jgi:hypothetical protein